MADVFSALKQHKQTEFMFIPQTSKLEVERSKHAPLIYEWIMLQNPIMICILLQLMEWNGMLPHTVMVLRLSN